MCGGVISNNDNSLGTGGGVYNEGCFELSGSAVISGNNAGYEGGGIYNKGTLIMSGGTIEKNHSGRGKGGGIYSNGNIVLSGSPNIVGNTAPNLYLVSEKLVSASGLAAGVKIRINTEAVPTDTTPVIITNDKVTENYFISENSAYETAINSEGYIVMNLKGASPAPKPNPEPTPNPEPEPRRHQPQSQAQHRIQIRHRKQQPRHRIQHQRQQLRLHQLQLLQQLRHRLR